MREVLTVFSLCINCGRRCSFSRFAGQINNDGSDFDLYDGAYYLLYGGGDTMGS